VDFAATPDASFTFGTSALTVFVVTALHGSGSAAYSAAAREGEADPETDPEGDAEGAPSVVVFAFVFVDEQPAMSITGTAAAAAQASSRVRCGADRCMDPSLTSVQIRTDSKRPAYAVRVIGPADVRVRRLPCVRRPGDPGSSE
jgi:hypothetical protein